MGEWVKRDRGAKLSIGEKAASKEKTREHELLARLGLESLGS